MRLQDPAARPTVTQLLSHAWLLKHAPAAGEATA